MVKCYVDEDLRKALGILPTPPTEGIPEYRASHLSKSQRDSERTILAIQTQEEDSPIYLEADRSVLIDHFRDHLRALGEGDERILDELRKIRQTLERIEAPALPTEVANAVVEMLDAVYALPRRKE